MEHEIRSFSVTSLFLYVNTQNCWDTSCQRESGVPDVNSEWQFRGLSRTGRQSWLPPHSTLVCSQSPSPVHTRADSCKARRPWDCHSLLLLLECSRALSQEPYTQPLQQDKEPKWILSPPTPAIKTGPKTPIQYKHLHREAMLVPWIVWRSNLDAFCLWGRGGTKVGGLEFIIILLPLSPECWATTPG